MTNHDLYRAIGEADESFLLACEQPTVRRISKRFGIIAAVMALILTACAPAAIHAFSALKEGSVNRLETYGYYELEPSVYEIWVDIDIAQDAPTSIETIYIPAVMKNYGSELTYEKYEWAVSFRHNNPNDGPEEFIGFHQVAYPSYARTGEAFVLGEFHADSDTEPQVTMKSFGDITILDIIHESPSWSSEAGAQYVAQRTVYWSDGYYLFLMNLPASWNDGQIEEMVASLTTVEDLSEFRVLKY